MILTMAETLIDLAALIAGIGGIACLVYLVTLLLWERHERRAFLDDYRRENAARRAGYVLDTEPARSSTARAPAPYATPPHSFQHHA